jgi:hypothetical protein
MSNFMIRTQIELQNFSRALAATFARAVERIRREDGQDLAEYGGVLILVAAIIGALIASVLTGVAIATRQGVHAARKTALPFGPYLAFGGVLAAFVGDPIIHAYLHLHH